MHLFMRLKTWLFSSYLVVWASPVAMCSWGVLQYSYLPQGEVEAKDRVVNMVNQMDKEGFGNCTNTGACEVECPKSISIEYIAKMNREFLSASCSSES